MCGYPFRSVLSDDHVSADMRTPSVPTPCLVQFVVYLDDQIDINWAHGVVVSHPRRMRKALGSNPSVSMHMCMRDNDGSLDYVLVVTLQIILLTHTHTHTHTRIARCLVQHRYYGVRSACIGSRLKMNSEPL